MYLLFVPKSFRGLILFQLFIGICIYLFCFQLSAAELQEDQFDASSRTWSSTLLYENIGIVVAHNGKLWRNTGWSKGEEPGSTGTNVWESIGLDFDTPPQFSITKIYELGNVVWWNSKLWECITTVRGAIPGESIEWVMVGYQSQPYIEGGDVNNADAVAGIVSGVWDPYISYIKVDVIVSHRGLLWKNSAPTGLGERPGENGVTVWQIVGLDREDNLDEWNINTYYAESTAVYYLQYIWVSRGDSQGQSPGLTTDWIMAKPLDRATLMWQATDKYSEGIVVRYHGSLWVSVRRVLSVSPPDDITSNDDWLRLSESNKLSGVFIERAWNAKHVYPLVGTLVNYREKNWVNNQVVLPSDDPPPVSGAWELMDGGSNANVSDSFSLAVDGIDQKWNVSKIYDIIGTVVEYDGKLYRNMQIVSGEPAPSENTSVWQLLEDALGRDSQQPNNWNESSIYTIEGRVVVNHNGMKWINRYWTQGDEPGKTLVWQPPEILDGDDWNEFVIYDGNREYVVTYAGQQWRNQWNSQGEEPGTSGAVWIAVTTNDDDGDGIWNAMTIYAGANSVVTHDGKEWFNRYWTQGEEPGKTLAWQPSEMVNGDDWNEFVTYDGNREYIVTYAGQQWRNQWYSLGEEPGTSGAAWIAVTTNDGDDDGDGIWNAMTIYTEANFVVTHDGKEWFNRYWTQGEEPGKTLAWRPSEIVDGDDWNKFVIYDGNREYIVIYAGQQWRNQWYSQGEEPGTSDAAWITVATNNGNSNGNSNWNAMTIYAEANSVVTHDSKEWFNRYWTQGEEPGKTLVWQPSEIVDGDDWNELVIYGGNREYIVTYAGQQWRNQWNSQGEVPGTLDAAWIVVTTN